MVSDEVSNSSSDKMKQNLGKEYEAFLYCLIHGLNTPLTVLMNACSDLSSSMDENAAQNFPLRERITEILGSSEEIDSLTRNVVFSLRLLNEKQHIHNEHLDIAEIVDSVLTVNIRKADRKYQSIVLELDETAGFSVNCDRFLVSTILGNVLDNAIKYSAHHSTIIVRSHRTNEDLCSISIIDEGPGIPESEAAMLFRRFSRLSTKPTGGETSLGLGLYVAHEMALLNHGILRYVPTESGACFELTLPFAPRGRSKNPISEP